MTLPSNAQVATALGNMFGDRVVIQGPPEAVAEVVLRIIRIANGEEGQWVRSADGSETVRWNAAEDFRQFRKDNPT